MFIKELDAVRIIYNEHVQEEAQFGRFGGHGTLIGAVLFLRRVQCTLLYLLNVHIWICGVLPENKYSFLA